MKAKKLMLLIQNTIDYMVANGSNPDEVEVCIYSPDDNPHNDWWEVTGVTFERGTPDYVEITTTPQTE